MAALFPEDIQSVLSALAPELNEHGCAVELLAVDDGVISIRLRPGTEACQLTIYAVKTWLEHSLRAAMPGVQRLVLAELAASTATE